MCRMPCTLNMLDDKPVAFCPLTGEKAQWKLVNKKWIDRGRVRQETKENPAIV